MNGIAGLVAGTGFGAGINLYGVVLLLGLLERSGAAEVPEVLGSPAVLIVAGLLYLAEFVADKIPYIDNAWDALHTLLRPAGAAVLGVLLASGAGEPGALAGAGAGGLALIAHAAKASARAAINTSPEPASNIAVSLAEDGLAAGLVWLAVHHPLVALLLVALLAAAAVALTVVLWRAARALAGRLRARAAGRRAGRPAA